MQVLHKSMQVKHWVRLGVPCSCTDRVHPLYVCNSPSFVIRASVSVLATLFLYNLKGENSRRISDISDRINKIADKLY